MYHWWIWPLGIVIGFVFGAVTPWLFMWFMESMEIEQRKEGPEGDQW